MEHYKISKLLNNSTVGYIVVKVRIIIEGDNNAEKRNEKLTFKNNAPF